MPPPTASPSRTLLPRVPGLVRGLHVRTPPPRIPTGLTGLDSLLAGGLPRGAVTELVGAGSSGRTALAHAITAAVTSRGDFAACIDLPDAFDPEHARAAGIDLGHLLWVRPPDLRKALQATEHVLSTGGFSLVLVDLDDRHHRHPRVPAGAWMRLARAAAHTRCAILVIAVQASVGIFAAVRLETERRHATFLDSASPSSLFDGMISTVHLRKSRLGSPDGTVAVLAATAVA